MGNALMCLGVTALLALVGLGAVIVARSSVEKAPADVTWGVDVTYSRPVSEFVRMHNTIATKTPFVLGVEAGLEPGIGTDTGSVLLNRYVGAAHATCFALSVEDFSDFNFRVCTSSEVLALSAVIPLSSTAHILTYASSDGDDYETGQVKHEIVLKPEDMYSYDFTESPPPFPNPPSGTPLAPPPNPPPPPNPQPPNQIMQSFLGSDNEVNLGTVETNLNLVSYCCSGVYTHMTGEGPSR